MAESVPTGEGDRELVRVASPMSENYASAEDGIGSEKKLAVIIGGLFFVLFLGWAAFTPLDSGAIGTGSIVVAGNKQAVQHNEGGVVSALNVSEGDTVKKGDVLLVLDSDSLVASERGITSEYLSLLAERERLQAEQSGAGSFDAPVELATMTGQNRQLAMQAMETQRRLFAARRGTMSSQKGVLGQRSRQNDERIEGLQRQLQSNRDQQRLINEELRALRELESRGFASKSRVREVERTAAALSGSEGQIEAEIAAARESIGENSMQSVTLGREIIEEASSRLREVSDRLDQLRPQMRAIRSQLARATVRAPESGKVVELNAFTVGGVIRPGETIMQVVPDNRELLVDVQISPRDADDVTVGQAAQVRFPSLQERTLPILNGVVTSMSADNLTDERTGASYFKVEVRVPEDEMAVLSTVRSNKNPLRPGLPAEIIVPLRKRTVLQYLTEPLTQMLWLAGRED